MQLGDRGRVAAAEAGQLGGFGQCVTIVWAVQAGAEQLTLLVGDHGRVTTTRGLAGAHRLGRPRVAVAHGLAQLTGIVGNRRGAGAAAAGSGLVLGPAAFALGLGLAARLLQ